MTCDGYSLGVFLSKMSRVSVSTFMLASLIGLLPTQCLNSYMGSSLRSIQDIKNQQSSSLLLLSQVPTALCFINVSLEPKGRS